MRRLLAACGVLVSVACGGGGGNGSPAPSPSPSPPPATTFTLTGQVTEPAPFTTNAIANARIEFVDGANAGKSATTDSNGNYVIANVNRGGFTVRASASGYVAVSSPVTITANGTLDFELPPNGPRKNFGPGQYRVGSEIAAGRYFADPDPGCYWERQSGFSGTLNDVIANDFIGFDALQIIVDVRSGDRAFQGDDECGRWYNSRRHGAQTRVSDGTWLVGSQVTPGTYRATTEDGCYWERLRNFTGQLSGIIANDFVGGGGVRRVTIRSSDVGFSTDEDCGVWTRESSGASVGDVRLSEESSPDAIERNWRLKRRKHGLR